jgi:ABC-type lipoprotein export system ATPase subunit
MGTSSYIISCHNVSWRRIKEFCLDIPQGEFVTITGEERAGKTTLLYLLCGSARPDTGKIIIDGHEEMEKNNLVRFGTTDVSQLSFLQQLAEERVMTDNKWILCADEPTPPVVDLLRQIYENDKTITIVMTTHNHQEFIYGTTRIKLEKGNIIG